MLMPLQGFRTAAALANLTRPTNPTDMVRPRDLNVTPAPIMPTTAVAQRVADRVAPQPESASGRLARAVLSMAIPVPGPAKEIEAARLARVVEQGAEGAAPKILAYHGSPHTFDAFSSHAIGTGEGNQAYGHGLYFAENEDVAKGYRNALSGTLSLDGKPIYANQQRVGTTGDGAVDAMLIDNGGDIDKALADTRYHLAPVGGGEKRMPEYTRRQLEALRGRVTSDNGGSMYQVGINAHPDHFIDWDSPFEAQHPMVQDALTAAGFTPPAEYLAPQRRTIGGSGIGRELQNPSETQALAAQGVPGIKYLDGGSRAAGDGTRNFVVFDPKNIDILKRYGISAVGLGALGAGAFGQQGPSQLQAPPPV